MSKFVQLTFKHFRNTYIKYNCLQYIFFFKIIVFLSLRLGKHFLYEFVCKNVLKVMRIRPFLFELPILLALMALEPLEAWANSTYTVIARIHLRRKFVVLLYLIRFRRKLRISPRELLVANDRFSVIAFTSSTETCYTSGDSVSFLHCTPTTSVATTAS